MGKSLGGTSQTMFLEQHCFSVMWGGKRLRNIILMLIPSAGTEYDVMVSDVHGSYLLKAFMASMDKRVSGNSCTDGQIKQM